MPRPTIRARARGRASDVLILVLAVPAALALLVGLFATGRFLAVDSDAFQAARREVVERGIVDDAFGRVSDLALPTFGNFQVAIVGEHGQAKFDAVVVGRRRSGPVAIEMTQDSRRQGWRITEVSESGRVLHPGPAAPTR